MAAEVGQTAPDFTLPDQVGEKVSIAQFKGQKTVVLSFHIFDFTGGWTNQVSSFNQANARFQEKGAQVLGISCDSQHAHHAWSNSLGNVNYPLLADFHPHGAMTKAYDLFNDANGAPRRAVIIVDKGGAVRFRQEYVRGTLPSTDDILAELDKIG